MSSGARQIKRRDEGADARRRPTSTQPDSVLTDRTVDEVTESWRPAEKLNRARRFAAYDPQLVATPSSKRTTLRRGAQRAEYDRAAQLAILDAGMVAHVGVGTTRGPLVLPMAYGRTADHVLLHGAARNGLLREAVGADVCVTVTIVDGLVIARTPFHNSMNYRSVVIRGVSEEIADPDRKREALKLISDQVVANWDTRRPPTDAEIRRTLILRVPLAEMSGKVRAGDPVDEDDDLDGPHWAGHVPINAVWGEPVGDPQLRAGNVTPKAIADLRDQPAY